jgi:hypothetical protein
MALKYVITIAYSALLAGGFYVGTWQIYQGFRKPRELLNPLFGNPIAIRLFTVHIVVVTCDLFIIGPLALAHKSTLYYWGGRILLLNASLPIAAYMNRNPQTFGNFIGGWVKLRNFFEYGIHVVFAALPLSWFRYYLLLWWLVAYRYLDVGPRRLLQRLYNTPEKKAARPWAQYVNWVTIVAIYIGAFFAVFYKQILFATVPGKSVHPHVPAHWETGVVIGVNVAVALFEWATIRKYTDSLMAKPGTGVSEPVAAAEYGSH